ncbi:MAG: hypothetical protein CL862_07085 [Cyanobium sp. NAT70]|nr:hypothetical protein [Cyanobium sp. NAT70]|tara:strand:- start:474 stop:653 length:180 start_codon:yes stop_codon:yes gene_type:complete
MSAEPPVTPLTALVVDNEGRLTYLGQDGVRRVILGNAELLDRIQPDHPDEVDPSTGNAD